MTWITLGIPAICYLIAAADFASAGKWGFSLAFAAYAVANVGFFLAAK